MSDVDLISSIYIVIYFEKSLYFIFYFYYFISQQD